MIRIARRRTATVERLIEGVYELRGIPRKKWHLTAESPSGASRRRPDRYRLRFRPQERGNVPFGAAFPDCGERCGAITRPPADCPQGWRARQIEPVEAMRSVGRQERVLEKLVRAVSFSDISNLPYDACGVPDALLGADVRGAVVSYYRER